MSLATAGIRCVCASLGTARRDSRHGCCCDLRQMCLFSYDGDESRAECGAEASDVLLGCGAQPRIVEIPGGDDPDSYVRARHAGALLTVFGRW
ncbi:MAG: hypothetical protein IPP40_13805 [bacterium]|nr:hypothetical protein [bacterium]